MGTPVNIIVGSQVWVEDPDIAWIDGEVLEIKGINATIITSNEKKIVANLGSIYPKDTEAPPAGVDDMTKLAYLHEPGVLQNLASRYALNEIYTYTGNILIAVNPFRRLPHLYDTHMMQQYKGATFGELSPHLFAVADACYRALINDHGSQSILVSGESGAGKTETTKMLMRYLAFMGGRSGTEGRTVEQQVLESNPVLEAFGNAKTVKNNNSSRFGKFVEIQFDKYGKISGAAVRTYLLERSRVCQVSDPERNYHCFYMLCNAPPEDVKRFKVSDPRSFHYLNQTSCYEVANVDDAREYLETRHAMDVVGIYQDEQDAIFRVVAAILHLGNINFAKGTEIDSSELRDEKSRYHLKTAAELLMCDEKSLADSLCERVIVTPDGNITKPLDPESAALSRDALAKTVYSRLFDWLVEKINNSIGQDPDAKHIIGVLDIYGFESFKVNSFEQLCINLTNEKLQQHFNQHVFKMEQEEYTKEEIDWSYVEFVDNQDVLDLIERKPGGIIALLDEACMFPKSTHETFAQKMYQTYKAHKRFSKPKLARTAFTINHYAGDVVYQADYFLDKNKDYVVAEHQALLNSSKCNFIANLIPPLPEETSKQSKFSSIGTRFKQQLQSLMETLSTTEPHYIRCVKPNAVLKPSIFENFNVLNQLRCGGVLEAIRISCAGYPTKRTFDEFIDRFGMLATDVIDSSDEKAACSAICDKMGLKGYQIGKTKVFLRAGQMAELDARRAEVLANAARIIQRLMKTYLSRKQFITTRFATITLQKYWRARLARKLYADMRREHASIRIQKYVRGHSKRKSYSQIYVATIVIQAGLRVMDARNKFRHLRRTKAATVIQTKWRGHKAYSEYKWLKKVALSLQCLWRGRVARKELRSLKMAARDAGALREAKDKLEKRVEELTWRIELEKHARTDLEEAKKQEIAKLQKTVEELQEKLKEAEEAIINEKEAARIAIAEAPPKIVEVPVVDNTKLDELINLNKELEDELSVFKTKTEEWETRFYQLESEKKEQVDQLQENIEKLDTMLYNQKFEHMMLRKESLEASSTNDDSLKQIESIENKIASLESENEMRVAAFETKIATLESENGMRVVSLENAISELQSENEMLRSRPIVTSSPVEDNHVESSDTEISTSELESESVDFKKLISELKSENEMLRSRPIVTSPRVEGNHVESSDAEISISELESENVDLKKLISELKSENEMLRSRPIVTSPRVEENHVESSDAEISISELESENVDLKKLISELKSENEMLRSRPIVTSPRVEENHVESSDAEISISELESENVDLKKLISELKSENEMLRSRPIVTSPRVEENHVESSDAEISISELESENVDLKKLISELKSENEMLRSRPIVTSPRVEENHVESSDAEISISELESENVDLKKLISELKSENEMLRSRPIVTSPRVEGNHVESSDAEISISELESENVDLKKLISELKSENEMLRSRPIVTSSPIEDNHVESSDTEISMSELELENVNLRMLISELKSENEMFRSRPIATSPRVEAYQQPITIERSISESLENGHHQDQPAEPIKILENGHQDEQFPFFQIHENGHGHDEPSITITEYETIPDPPQIRSHPFISSPVVTQPVSPFSMEPLITLSPDPILPHTSSLGETEAISPLVIESVPPSPEASRPSSPVTTELVSPVITYPITRPSSPVATERVSRVVKRIITQPSSPFTPEPVSPGLTHLISFTSVNAQTITPTLSKQKSLTDRQQESHDLLIKCLLEEKRFDKNRPVTACIVYKSLLHWNSFQAEKTTIFERIIETIKTSLTQNQENAGELAYWLSTTSTLLYLVQNTLKSSNRVTKSLSRSRSTNVSLFSRLAMAQNMRCPSTVGISGGGYSGMTVKTNTSGRFDVKYPALLFKQHLAACVEKIYNMIRDNLKKEIGPFLTMCIQAPRSMRARSLRALSKSIHTSIVAKQASTVHWQSIVKCFDNNLQILDQNFVPNVIIRKAFSQVFSYMNVQLFNSLLLRRECCSSSNGEFLKAGLQEFEQWCLKTTEEYAGTSWEELNSIRQAASFLVLRQKSVKSLEEIIELCSELSLTQIYRIGTTFWDDKYGTPGLSQDTIGNLRAMTSPDDSTTVPHYSFLLDDDSSVPFSIEDLSKSALDISLSDLEPPPLLRQNSEFHFLLQHHID